MAVRKPITREQALHLQILTFGHTLRHLVQNPDLPVKGTAGGEMRLSRVYRRFHLRNRAAIRRSRQMHLKGQR